MKSLAVLGTADYWKGVGYALFRTFVAAVAPILLAYSAGQPVAWLTALSQVVLVLIVAVLTSISGLPQPGPDAGFWEILGSRFLRQFAQFLIAGIGTSILVQNVPWQALLLGALSSAFATALMASLVVIPGVNVAQANTTVQASGSTVIVNTSPATSVDTVEDTTEAVPSGDGYV